MRNHLIPSRHEPPDPDSAERRSLWRILRLRKSTMSPQMVTAKTTKNSQSTCQSHSENDEYSGGLKFRQNSISHGHALSTNRDSCTTPQVITMTRGTHRHLSLVFGLRRSHKAAKAPITRNATCLITSNYLVQVSNHGRPQNSSWRRSGGSRRIVDGSKERLQNCISSGWPNLSIISSGWRPVPLRKSKGSLNILLSMACMSKGQ